MSIEDYNSSKSPSDDDVKNKLYQAIAETYKYVMFSGANNWLGYTGSVGFQVEGLGFFEPPLQKLLSLLHMKKNTISANEYIKLLEKSIVALRNFDYTKEVLPEYQSDFVNMGCPEIIKQVANTLEEAIKSVSTQNNDLLKREGLLIATGIRKRYSNI